LPTALQSSLGILDFQKRHVRGVEQSALQFRDITAHIRTRDEDTEITLQWSWSGLCCQFSINIYDVFFTVSKLLVPYFCNWITQ